MEDIINSECISDILVLFVPNPDLYTNMSAIDAKVNIFLYIPCKLSGKIVHMHTYNCYVDIIWLTIFPVGTEVHLLRGFKNFTENPLKNLQNIKQSNSFQFRSFFSFNSINSYSHIVSIVDHLFGYISSRSLTQLTVLSLLLAPWISSML